MRIFTVFVAVISLFALLTMSSCTRDYTCQCTISYSGVPGLPDTSVNEYTIRDTRNKAKTICEANSASYEKDNVKTVETCKLF